MFRKYLNKKYRNRIITFLIFAVLIFIILFTDNLYVRLSLGSVLIIYVAFLIFLRETTKKNINPAVETSISLKSDISQSEKIPDEGSILSSQDLKSMKIGENIHPFVPDNLKQKYYEIATESLPDDISQDSQFTFVLEKILNVIKSTMYAHSVIYFWYNRIKEQLIIQSFKSDNKEIHKAKFELGGDIISKVVRNESPEVLNNINSNMESDVVAYYDKPVGIKSVVAVPVFFKDKMIGVLAVDSKAEDAFGFETVYLLGRYVRMISLLFSVFEEKYDDFLIRQKLEALSLLLEESENYQTEKAFLNKFINLVDELIECDACTIVLGDNLDKNYKVVKVLNKTSLKYLGEGLIIDYFNSWVGNTIEVGRPLKIDDISPEKKHIYSVSEPVNFGGSVIIIPIRYNEQNLGALVFENLRKNFYSNNDVLFLVKISKYLAHTLNSISLINFFNSHNSIDLESRLLNRQAFEKRLNEEFSRARDTNSNIGLALIAIDKFENYVIELGQKVIVELIRHLSHILQRETSKLMILGRLDTNKIGIIFYNIDDQEAYVWCERLRLKIFKEQFKTKDGSRSFPLMLSIGYAGGRKSPNETSLFENSEKALVRAQKTGNNVSFLK